MNGGIVFEMTEKSIRKVLAVWNVTSHSQCKAGPGRDHFYNFSVWSNLPFQLPPLDWNSASAKLFSALSWLMFPCLFRLGFDQKLTVFCTLTIDIKIIWFSFIVKRFNDFFTLKNVIILFCHISIMIFYAFRPQLYTHHYLNTLFTYIC